MRLSGAISIRRLLRRSAIRIGYGSGLPHDCTGLLRSPVIGGTGGSTAPLDTTPAPRISGVTVTALPSREGLAALVAAWDCASASDPQRICTLRPSRSAQASALGEWRCSDVCILEASCDEERNVHVAAPARSPRCSRSSPVAWAVLELTQVASRRAALNLTQEESRHAWKDVPS